MGLKGSLVRVREMLMGYEVDWLLDKADNDEIALASFIVKNNSDKIIVTKYL